MAALQQAQWLSGNQAAQAAQWAQQYSGMPASVETPQPPKETPEWEKARQALASIQKESAPAEVGINVFPARVAGTPEMQPPVPQDTTGVQPYYPWYQQYPYCYNMHPYNNYYAQYSMGVQYSMYPHAQMATQYPPTTFAQQTPQTPEAQPPDLPESSHLPPQPPTPPQPPPPPLLPQPPTPPGNKPAFPERTRIFPTATSSCSPFVESVKREVKSPQQWQKGKPNFKLSGAVNQHNCVYYATENPKVTIEQQLKQPGVTVWASLSCKGVVGPIILHRTIDQHVYLNMLTDTIIPQVREQQQQDDFYFQQDGAPPHFALTVRALLDKEFPN
uniref:leukocyte receptor cluster member 8 homolog n=1 Tax=Myxine glutinosa TaxID=7769 RepID=UPI0035902CAC